MREETSSSRLHGQYDNASKKTIQEYPEDWVAFTLGTEDVEVVEILETEQPTVQAHRADSFIKVRLRGEEAIVHIEIQTHDSRDVPMPYRMVGYIGRGVETFRLPILSHVVYLRRQAGRNDPGEYVQRFPGYEVRIPYKVIRLSAVEGRAFLESAPKGLLPFLPLMRPPENMEGAVWLQECVDVADSASRGMSDREEYLTSLAILSGLAFDYETIKRVIKEIDMEESAVIQHFLQKGREQGLEQGIERGLERGTRESLIESILVNLEVRFNTDALQHIATPLAAIQDIGKLKQLQRETLLTQSLDAFQQALNNGNATK